MLSLTLIAIDDKNPIQRTTRSINVSNMEEFEKVYKAFILCIPYEIFHLNVVSNSDTLSTKQLKLYKTIVQHYWLPFLSAKNKLLESVK